MTVVKSGRSPALAENRSINDAKVKIDLLREGSKPPLKEAQRDLPLVLFRQENTASLLK